MRPVNFEVNSGAEEFINWLKPRITDAIWGDEVGIEIEEFGLIRWTSPQMQANEGGSFTK